MISTVFWAVNNISLFSIAIFIIKVSKTTCPVSQFMESLFDCFGLATRCGAKSHSLSRSSAEAERTLYYTTRAFFILCKKEKETVPFDQITR